VPDLSLSDATEDRRIYRPPVNQYDDAKGEFSQKGTGGAELIFNFFAG
jgi:hypothetical protein